MLVSGSSPVILTPTDIREEREEENFCTEKEREEKKGRERRGKKPGEARPL